jgi:hypothetical protein
VNIHPVYSSGIFAAGLSLIKNAGLLPAFFVGYWMFKKYLSARPDNPIVLENEIERLKNI